MKKHLLTLLAVTSFAALTLNLAAQADFYPQIKAGVKPDTNAAGNTIIEQSAAQAATWP